ncbi:hypothetical protein L1887_33950 [Cichorium endivia]|nr:hypothetical protein L1887_33950 [Cichorium endivia]
MTSTVHPPVLLKYCGNRLQNAINHGLIEEEKMAAASLLIRAVADGLGVPSFNSLRSRSSSSSNHGREDGICLMWVLQLYALSLEISE